MNVFDGDQAQPEPTHEAMRARLTAKIAEQDAARGRPLTDRERLVNLKRFLATLEPEGKDHD